MKVICKKALCERITVGKIYDIVHNTRLSTFKYYLIADDNDRLYMTCSYVDSVYFSGIDKVRNKKLEDLGI